MRLIASLSFFVTFSVIVQADDFDSLQKQKTAAQKKLEESFNSIEDDELKDQIPSDVVDQIRSRNEKIPDDERVIPLKGVQPLAQTSKADPSQGGIPSKTKVSSLPQKFTSGSQASGPARYLRNLRNAYGCTKDFLSNLFQARAKRDLEQADCLSKTGGKSCDERASNDRDQKSTTLTDEFYTCLDQEELQ